MITSFMFYFIADLAIMKNYKDLVNYQNNDQLPIVRTVGSLLHVTIPHIHARVEDLLLLL